MERNILARLHNEGIIYVLNSLERIPDENEIPVVVESLIKDFCKEFDLPFEPLTLPEFPPNIDDLDLNSWVDQSSYSHDFKRLAKDTLNVFDRELGIVEAFQEFDRLLNQAKTTLTESEFYIYDDHIYVAKRSMEFWLSEVNSNRIWLINTPILENPSREPINWWKVFGCDCVGGLFGGAAGYIGASLISVIMQW